MQTEVHAKTAARMSTKNLALSALFIALSFLGANIKIPGTSIALDSLPAFLAALLLGPVYGAFIGFFGHLFTAMTSGFYLSIPIHAGVAVSMALTMICFGLSYRKMKNRVPEPVNIAATGIIGVLLNGPISLSLSIGITALMAGTAAALGMLALLPLLVGAAAANIAISFCLFKLLEKPWRQIGS